MMNVYHPSEGLATQPLGQEPPPFHWLPAMLRFLRRRWMTIVGSAAAVSGLAMLYLLVATQLYIATTSLLIDIRRTNPFRQQPIIADSQYENVWVESQVTMLRSGGLARQVVRRLDLLNDPSFNGIGRGIIGTIIHVAGGLMGRTGSDGEADTQRREIIAAEKLQKLITIRRIGMTAVVEVSVRTPDPVLSARLSNAVAEGYLQDQLAIVSALSSQASNWLRARTAELRSEAVAADRAVQDYKARANILETDKGQFAEQQLGELSTQLSAARARVADAQSKFDRIRSLNTDRLADATMPEALENTVIVGLRKQYLDARRRESEWSGRFGANHAAAVNARNEMAELQRSIQNELNRISDTYRGELEVAKATEAQIGRQLSELAAAYAAANSDRIMLRSLQSSADSYRTIYENFLQRHTQAVQDQSFPIPEARIVTAAQPPLKHSHPQTILVLAVGMVLGFVVGIGLAVMRELLDRGLRTPAQVKLATGHDCLALVPWLPGRLRVTSGGSEAEPAVRQLATQPSALRQVADQPDSPFAEALRGIALRTTWRRRTHGGLVIGCVASQPGDGATTIAANLAQAFAESGHSTLLVDLDLRQPNLTRALAPQNAGGAAEVAEGAMQLDQVVWRDTQTGLHFLPAAAGRSAARPARVLAPGRADRLVAALRAGYDRVVIDLPPSGTNADAGALAELLDGLVLVTSWGGLEGEALAELIDGLGHDKLLGVVLNRVQTRRLKSYGVFSHGSARHLGAQARA